MKATQKKQVRESLELIEKAIDKAFEAKGEIGQLRDEIKEQYNKLTPKQLEENKGNILYEELYNIGSAFMDIQMVLQRLEDTKSSLQKIKL